MTTTVSILRTGAQIVLGLIFFVFGLNGFFGFMPIPPMNPEAGAFMGALAATGYMFPLIKGTEVFAGALLLSGRAVPLALVLLSPIIVNIAAFHLVLQPGVGMVVVLLGLQGGLAYSYRSSFAALFGRHASPARKPAESGSGALQARAA